MRRRHRLAARRCGRGHLSVQLDERCRVCGDAMHDVTIRADAVLELITTVRVNPTGEPFQLGVAVTRAGRVRTICRVEGAVRGHGNDRVVLERRGDVVVARTRYFVPRPPDNMARRRAVTRRSRARSASRRYGRRY